MKFEKRKRVRELHVEYEQAKISKKKISIFGVFVAIYSEKLRRQFFGLQCFGGSTNRRRKLMTYLES